MNNILVAGGAGYIGSHAVQLLIEQGYCPLVLDSLVTGFQRPIEDLNALFIEGDICDTDLVKTILSGKHPRAKSKVIDGILHFAASAYVGESVECPAKYYSNNVANSLSFLQCIIEENAHRRVTPQGKASIPVVFSSSCATFGIPNVGINKIDEEQPQKPISPYGWSKLFVEQMLRDFFNAYSLPSCTLRYFNAAGSDPKGIIGELHNPETHIIPLLLDACFDTSKTFTINGSDYNTPDGSCIRDYVHVCDLAQAHILALEKLYSSPGCYNYNLGSEQGVSVNELINAVTGVTGITPSVKFGARRIGDPPRLVASAKKAYTELDWRPERSELCTIISDAWNWKRLVNHTIC